MKHAGRQLGARRRRPAGDGEGEARLKARSEGLGGAGVTLALQNTVTWRSLFNYQSFTPREERKELTLLVCANATAPSETRFQIWHGQAGTLWLADVRMAPWAPPSEGRWGT